MKKKYVSVLMSVAIASLAQAQERTFEEFDFAWGDAAGQWEYVDEGVKCGWMTAKSQQLCGEEMALLMYTQQNPSSPGGYLRHGFMHTVKNQEGGYALALTYTSGEVLVDKATRTTEYQGTKLTSYDDFQARHPNMTLNDFGLDPMPGEPQLYLQPHSGSAPSSPLFDGVANRFNLYVWYPASAQRHWQYSRKESHVPAKTLAWYPFVDTARAGHYYHHVTNRAYGSWIKVQFDGHPTHVNHGTLPQTGWLDQGGRTADTAQDYFSRLASFSLRFHAMGGSTSPYTLQTDHWTYEYVTGENEETINNVGVGFDPERREFDISLEDKYRCQQCEARYQVKYSFTPFTQAGFESSDQFAEINNYYAQDNIDPTVIVKPNPGYNQLWAKLTLPAVAVERYLSGETLYFAIQDISDRSFATDPKDNMLTSTDAGNRKQWQLIKTIDITYLPPPEAMQITVPSHVATPGGYVNITLGNPGLDDVHESKPEAGWSNVRQESPDASTIIGAIHSDTDYTIDLKGLSDYRIAAARRIQVTPLVDPCSASSCADERRDLSAMMQPQPFVMQAMDAPWQSVALRGMAHEVSQDDVLAVTVQNDGQQFQHINPHVLFHVSGVQTLTNADNLHNMSYHRVYPDGQQQTWYYPLSVLGRASLDELTIMLPDDIPGLSVSSVKIVGQ